MQWLSLGEDKRTQRHREESHIKVEAETGIFAPQVRVYQEPTEAGSKHFLLCNTFSSITMYLIIVTLYCLRGLTI